jgi:hypothetical protein
MQGRGLAGSLIAIGLLGLVGSAVWWFVFFANLSATFWRTRTSVLTDWHTIQCLFWSSGPCGTATELASAYGQFAYQPMALWLSAVALVIGLVMKSAAK